MYKQLLQDIGRRLEIDSQGRISLGTEYASKENWFLYYDLACEGVFILCSGLFEGEGLVKAYIKPLTIDNRGRLYLPEKLREKFNGALLLKRDNHIVIVFNQSNVKSQPTFIPTSLEDDFL